MKVAVALCLFACVAVSHGAFSRNLVQETKPLVNQIAFNARLAGGSNGLQTALVEGIQAHIQSLLSQIQTGVATASGIYDDVLAQVQTAQAQLAGGVQGQVTEIVTSLVQTLQSLFGGLFNGQKGLFDWFSSFDVGAIIRRIKEFIAAQAEQIDIQDAAHTVMTQMGVNPTLSQFISGHLSSLLGQDRGMLDGILGGSFTTQLQAAFQNVLDSIGPIVAHLQSLAQGFITQFEAQISAVSAEIMAEAQNLLSTLGPIAGQVGPVFQHLQQIVAGFAQGQAY